MWPPLGRAAQSRDVQRKNTCTSDSVFRHLPKERAVGLDGQSFEELSAIFALPGGGDTCHAITAADRCTPRAAEHPYL